MSIRAPEGYYDEEADRDVDGGLTALPMDIRNAVQLRVEQGDPFGDDDVDVFAANRIEDPETGRPMQRLPDVVVAGETFYQISGEDPLFVGRVHEFGARDDRYDIFVYIRSNLEIPQAERDAINAAVLASVTLPPDPAD